MLNYLDRFKMASCPLKRDGFLIPNLINFVEPKMERKYATEYSTAEKWASESLKGAKNSYHEVPLRSLFRV